VITTSTNVHNVTALKVKSKEFTGMNPFWSTEVTVTDKDGHEFIFSFFSAEPLAIEGAEHVNAVASSEVA
jgi:hypothetical protein